MNEILRSAITPISIPAWWVPAATAVLALLTTMAAALPRISRSRRAAFGLAAFGTIVHEAGHALAGCLTGGGVYLIQIHTPDSGITHTWHYSRLSDVLTTAAGYAMPPLAGLGAAALLARGHSPMVLALTVVAMALVLLLSRDWITVLCVLLVGSVALVGLYWGTPAVQHWIAYAEAWLLLLSELPGLWNLVQMRRHRVDSADDAVYLAEVTRIPSAVWITAWLALNLWALWVAVPLLWP